MSQQHHFNFNFTGPDGTYVSVTLRGDDEAEELRSLNEGLTEKVRRLSSDLQASEKRASVLAEFIEAKIPAAESAEVNSIVAHYRIPY